jgi:hyaluronoglucosaminidase
MCATACGAGSSVAPRTWQRGGDYAYVATDLGIVPINLGHASVGTPLLAGGVTHGFSVATAPGGRTAYIGYGNGITPLNLSSGRVGKSFATKVDWSSFAMAPDGRTIYLSGFDNRTSKSTNEIIPVSTTNGLVGHPIPVPPNEPNDVSAISPNGETAYVITEYGADITPVNLVTGLAGTPIGVPDGVNALAVTPDGTTAYAVGATT